MWKLFLKYLIFVFQLSPQEILAIGQKPYSGSNEDGVLSSSLSTVKRALVPLTSLISPKVLDLSESQFLFIIIYNVFC